MANLSFRRLSPLDAFVTGSARAERRVRPIGLAAACSALESYATRRTGQGASWTTRLATEPMIRRSMSPAPRVCR